MVSWECGGSGGGVSVRLEQEPPLGNNDGYKVPWGNMEHNLLFRTSYSDELH